MRSSSVRVSVRDFPLFGAFLYDEYTSREYSRRCSENPAAARPKKESKSEFGMQSRYIRMIRQNPTFLTLPQLDYRFQNKR